MIDLRAQFATIEKEIRSAIEPVLMSQQFVLGPQLEALEREMARYCARSFGIGVASGTDALMLSLRACDVGPGDEVVVPTFTFVATAGAVSALGARPVFADIDAETLNVSPESVAARITPRTRAVIAVHLYGLAARIEALTELAAQRRVAVIEDNAQSLGATCAGRPVGSFGALAATSFYPSKNLGAYGDAGMILTDSAELAARLRALRHHGQVAHGRSVEPGWNSRLDELQAAVLRVKLRHLDEWIRARRRLAARYDGLLSSCEGVQVPRVPANCEPTYYLYTVRIAGSRTQPSGHRDHVARHLARKGIATSVFYPVPLHLQPLYAELGGRPSDLPVAERAAQEVLSLPLYPEMTPGDVERVASAVLEAMRR
jgi:dTDP-4-amino-4,6-dideoxygalactose transaminase